MSNDLKEWRNFSPGDLSVAFPAHEPVEVGPAVERSLAAFRQWSAVPFDDRRALLEQCRARFEAKAGEFARLISSETGKPLREARLELGAVVGKFDFTFSDGERYLRDEEVSDGPHPAMVRRRPRGPAAVIAPFNFPMHLGHGATVAYLLAGNTVLYKPSPFAVNTGAAYAAELRAVLPEGVLEFVPGGSDTGRELVAHPNVRAVCFTGSIPVGTALARDLAEDYSKSLALELGGKNSAIVWEDADLDAAAAAVADGMCLTAGQRCNATSRVLAHASIASRFTEKLLAELKRFSPGDPLDENTTLGPLISQASVDRFRELSALPVGRWILPGTVPGALESGKSGHYVTPAVVLAEDVEALDASDLARRETFAPILVIESVSDEEAAVARHDAWLFGLTATIFCEDEAVFRRIGDRLAVGNLYRNLPTTFSPSSLPFGGWGRSGNGRPGARGFARFAADEQAVQWKA